MTDYAKVEILHERLADERRRIVETAAATDMTPPAGLLAYLSDLDSAIVAVEAVLDERTTRLAFTDQHVEDLGRAPRTGVGLVERAA